MVEESSTITFESLYDMVRKEKTNEELQKLNPQVFIQIVNYLKTKAETYKRSKEDTNFNPSELEKIKTQIINARKLVKELYERRERKILMLAIIKSRVKSVDESSLLEEEKPFFEEATKFLDKYRESILLNLINSRMPSVREAIINNILEERHEDEKEDTKLPEKEQRHELNQLIKIRFLGSVPSFLGKNLEIFGPFVEGDIAKLPKEISDILVNRKIAEEIN